MCMIRSITKDGEATIKENGAKFLSDLPYLFTTAEALSIGIPRVTLHRLAQRGEIRPITRGLYMRGAERVVDLDLAEIAEHGLTDAISQRIDIAIARGTWAPKTMAAVSWHRFDPGSFEWGRNEQPIPGTNLTIGIYSAERTLADLARHPRLDQAELVEGIRRWLWRPGNHPAKLLKSAQKLPGARFHIQRILEILT
jgi:hypothetical protein